MQFKSQKTHWWFVTKKEIVLNAIEKYLSPAVDIKILDIGCGSGLMLPSLEVIGETSGMDTSDEAIAFSKEISRAKIEKGFLPKQVPYQESSFNLITALDVIEHIDEDIESLKTIHSRLVTGGKAIITVPAYMFLWTKFDEFNEHKRRYTLIELRNKLKEAGFEIEKISYYNTIFFPIVCFVRALNKLCNRNGASDVEMPSAPLNYILKKIFGIEKSLLNIMNMPYGVSILAVVKKSSYGGK